MQRCLLTCGLLALLAVSPWTKAGDIKPAAGEWPQWRGPNRDGVSTETGLLMEWPKAGPRLDWKATGLGKGYASVAIVGGKIFTMGDRNREAFVMARDQATGKEIWAMKVGRPWNDGGPRCTPTVDDGLVFALSPHGDLVCVDADTGNERWRKNLAADFGGKMMSGWGHSESPLVDGDKLICTPGGKDATLVALQKRTGDVVWKCQVPEGDGAAYSSVVVSEGGGVRQYVQLLGRGIVGVRAADGKFLWRYNRIANGTANIPTPLVKDDYIFCSTGYRTGSALLQLTGTADGGVKAKEVYFLSGQEMQNHHGGLVLVDGYVYGGHGHNAGAPVCVELKTGKVVWKQQPAPGERSAAVVYADGHLYFRYENGLMALVEATPAGYKAKGTFQIPNVNAPSWPHPVVAGGKLYLREQDQLLCYDVKQ